MHRLNYYKLVFLLVATSISNVVLAQPGLSPEVKHLLDSSGRHIKDGRDIEFLLRAEKVAKGQYSDEGLGVVYQRLGSAYYTKQPDLSFKYFKQAYDLFIKTGDMKGAGISLHSLGFVSEEQLHNIPQATTYIEQAIELHQSTHDTMELANMYKYLGMLKGKQGKYAEGKADARKAIRYFKIKKYDPGVAVSYFDIAKIFVAEKKYDSAARYLLDAKGFWLSKKGNERVFNINNELTDIYMLGKSKNAEAVLAENEAILTKSKIYFKDKLTYYKNSYSYYNSNHSKGKAGAYLNRYNALKDSLVSKGVKVE